MKLLSMPILIMGMVGALPLHAAETQLRLDRAGNVVAVVPASSGTISPQTVVDPPFATVGERVLVHAQLDQNADSVSFANAAQAPLSSDSSGIGFVVPAGASSGPLQLRAAGSVLSTAENFVVLPAEIPSSAVAGVSAAVPDQSMDLGLIGNQWTLLTFDGDEAGAASLDISSIDQPAASDIELRMINPAGVVVLSTSISMTAPLTHLPVPQVSGVHVLALRSTRWARVRASITTDVELVADDQATTVTTTLAAPTVRAYFTATAGESYGLGINALTTSPASRLIEVKVYRPNGSLYRTATCGSTSTTAQDKCDAVMRNLPDTGIYTALVAPRDTPSFSLTANLWLSREVEQDIAIGTPLSLSITRPGQIATLRFDAVTGQRLQLGFSNFASPQSSANLKMVTREPDGDCLVSSNCAAWTRAFDGLLEFPVLPVDGRYAIQVELWNNGVQSFTGAATLTLTEDAVSNLTADVGYAQLSAPLYGQRHRLQFDALAGESYGLGISALTTSPSSRHIEVKVYQPNGSLYRTALCGSTSTDVQDRCAAVMRDLPESGTYTALVKSLDTGALSYSVRIWLSRELEQEIAIGTPLSLDLPRPGQIATLHFDAVTGHRLQLGFSNFSSPQNFASLKMVARVPDGTCLVSTNCAAWIQAYDGLLEYPVLPVDGRYSIEAVLRNNGTQASTGSATLTLTEDAVSTLTADLGYAQLNAPLYGQRHRLQFDALAGESYGLGVSALSTSPASRHIEVKVYQPNGTLYRTASCGSTATAVQNKCAAAMRNLPESGTYIALVKSLDTQALSYSARIWLSRELAHSVTLGSPLALALPRPGQIATLSFNGTTGQILRLTASSFATSPLNSSFEFVPVRPTGVCLLSTNCAPWRVNANAYRDLPALLENGQHTVRVGFYNDGRQSPSGSVSLILAPKP